MIRLTKILLVILVGLWGLIGAAGNLMNLAGVYAMVRATTRMPGFDPGAAPPWATEHPMILGLGVVLIVLGKLIPAVLCSWGSVHMVRARNEPAEVWQQSKSMAIVGCGLAMALLFLGWVVIGEFVFMMFLDEGLANASNAAFRYGGFIALIMIFVAQKE